jgi:hypothetical protein
MTLYSYLKSSGRAARGSVLGIILFAAACSAGPPVQEMSDARQAISAAREAGASNAAPEELRAAEDYLDSALRNLTRKEYGQAREDAREAKNMAVAALDTTERAAQDEPRP